MDVTNFEGLEGDVIVNNWLHFLNVNRAILEIRMTKKDDTLLEQAEPETRTTMLLLKWGGSGIREHRETGKWALI